jgi:hypothetical protein
MYSTKKIIGSAILALGLGSITASALANTATWDQNHPRRAEVNQRLGNQNARIHNKVAAGDMSKAKAAKLHKEDHQIRSEERMMASQNNGHITKQEQKTLNQQENKVSEQIAR